MSELKICTKCGIAKEPMTDFYLSGDKIRSECKRCTIARSVAYQKRERSWETSYESADARKAYMRSYYSKNKEKFAAYRADLKKRNPHYHRDYARMQDEKRSEQPEAPTPKKQRKTKS